MIHIARLGDKLFVMDGVNSLAYVDLTKVNKGSKYKAVVRYPKTALARIIIRLKGGIRWPL